MELKPTPTQDACPACGSRDDMSLAEEFTQYRRVRMVDGQWEAGDVVTTAPTSTSAEEDRVRFFCANCGAYFKLPKSLYEHAQTQ